METNVIIKYRRAEDCWACPNCDSENSMPYNRCTVCGFEKNSSVQILKAWSPELERVEAMAAARSARPMSAPMSRPMSAPMSSTPGYSIPPAPESKSGSVGWIVLAIVVIAIIVFVCSQ